MGISTSIFDEDYNSLELLKTYLGDDEHSNALAIHSDEYDFDAADWNRVVAGLSECALRARIGNLIALSFSQANCVATQTDVNLTRDGDSANKRFVAPFKGSVVAMSINCENARSAGTCIVNWRKGTVSSMTKGTLACVLNADPTQIDTATQDPGVETFTAGQVIDVVVTTDSGWAASTTPSLICDLILSLGD